MVSIVLILATLSFAGTVAAQAPTRITPASRPLTTISLPVTATGGGRVTDAQRLIDGRVLVVRTAPGTLQTYRSTGTLDRELARAAPTERFKGRLTLLGSTATGINVADDGDATISRFTPAGGLLATEPLKAADYVVRFLLVRNTLLYDLTPGVIGCVREAVATLPSTAGTLREARFDPAGRFWWRADGAEEWTVTDLTGRRLAQVALPAGFLLYQLGDGYVVGKTVQGGAEQVQVLALRFPDAAPIRPACMDRPEDLRPELAGTAPIRAMLGYAVDYMSRARAQGNYPTDLTNAFGATRLPAGTSFRVHRAGPPGFALIGETSNGSLRCLTAVGDLFPGLPENYILCGS